MAAAPPPQRVTARWWCRARSASTTRCLWWSWGASRCSPVSTRPSWSPRTSGSSRRSWRPRSRAGTRTWARSCASRWSRPSRGRRARRRRAGQRLMRPAAAGQPARTPPQVQAGGHCHGATAPTPSRATAAAAARRPQEAVTVAATRRRTCTRWARLRRCTPSSPATPRTRRSCCCWGTGASGGRPRSRVTHCACTWSTCVTSHTPTTTSSRPPPWSWSTPCATCCTSTRCTASSSARCCHSRGPSTCRTCRGWWTRRRR
mmetsp:Transcript_28790/g.73375  ORF Transcript_28790/g.73375 Transcript_28790/m.73375 type:complete len:260 (-) Transcript_28790:2231-3010(-)